MIKKTFPLFLATALALGACSTNDDVTDQSNNEGKELIWFGSANNTPKTRAGFGASTRIVAQIVSEPRTGSDPTTAKYTKAVLTADADATQSTTTFSNVGYAANYSNKYWDDAHGRYSRLSVYAVAIPSQTTKTVDGVATPIIGDDKLSGSLTSWEGTTDMTNTIAWGVSTAQTATELNQEDLTYSNNIQKTGDKGCYIWTGSAYPSIENVSRHSYTENEETKYDGRLHFEQAGVACNVTPTDAPGHFDKGQMAFKHSLSRIRVKIQKGSSFTDGAFAFATGTTITLKNMPVSGTFNIKEGTWAASPTISDITKMAPVTVPVSETGYEMASAGSQTNAIGAYEAQMLPGFQFADANGNNVMEFTIDGNKYFVTNKEMMNALKADANINDDATSYTTLQGYRYVFTVTVGKKKIEAITATIVPWNNVTAQEQTVDNSHVTFSFYNNEIECDDVKLYKNTQSLGEGVIATDNEYSADPVAGAAYTNVTLVGTEAPYSTNEYYNDNNTAYHFRSLNTVSENKLNSDKTAFTMTSGNDDYHWGAPMLPTTLTAIPYNSENGYKATIAKGIVAADKNSNIVLTELHMMSQLEIRLTTPEVGGVDLTDAEVYLTKYYADGTVDMSFGKITPATMTAKSSKFTAAASPATNTYVFNVIPQDLIRNEGANDNDYIGITIKTKDNNEYYIIKRLSEIIATSVGTEVTNLQTKDAKITTWYPGHKYSYTFNIKKKEIEVITATIVPWNTVTAGNTDLDLEK